MNTALIANFCKIPLRSRNAAIGRAPILNQNLSCDAPAVVLPSTVVKSINMPIGNGNTRENVDCQPFSDKNMPMIADAIWPETIGVARS